MTNEITMTAEEFKAKWVAIRNLIMPIAHALYLANMADTSGSTMPSAIACETFEHLNKAWCGCNSG